MQPSRSGAGLSKSALRRGGGGAGLRMAPGLCGTEGAAGGGESAGAQPPRTPRSGRPAGRAAGVRRHLSEAAASKNDRPGAEQAYGCDTP